MPAKDTKVAQPKKAASKGAAKPVAKKGAAVRSRGAAKKAPAVKGKVAAKPVVEKPRGSKFKALYTKQKRINRGIGQNPQRPGRDLTRYVRWPRYIRIARQKRVLYQRLKVPPAINQFTRTLDRNATSALFKLLRKYRPEEHQAKRARLLKVAEARAKGEVAETHKKPLSVIAGATQVVKSIESKQAKLVVLAGDVDPIELIIALPTLCRRLDIPYIIIKSKARLGAIVRRKTVSALAVVDVKKEDKNELATLVTIARESFNDNIEHRRQWGGGKLGQKSASKIAKHQRLIAKEQAARGKNV
jgi:large subunit ribosomal protein L7Ae